MLTIKSDYGRHFGLTFFLIVEVAGGIITGKIFGIKYIRIQVIPQGFFI